MKEHKFIKVLTFTVLVEIRDDMVEEVPEYADGGVHDGPFMKNGRICFKIWFSLVRGLPAIQHIVHECWHLYMTILKYIDEHEHTFEELNNEVYAYTFQDSFQNIFNTILTSKIYQKLIEKESSVKKFIN